MQRPSGRLGQSVYSRNSGEAETEHGEDVVDGPGGYLEVAVKALG